MSEVTRADIETIAAISTYNLLGKFKLPDDQDRVEMYTVFGTVRRVVASEGGKGTRLVLHGQFGAFIETSERDIKEFRADKAYLPEELSRHIIGRFKEVRQADKKAEMQILYRIHAQRNPQHVLGYDTKTDTGYCSAVDAFDIVRNEVLNRGRTRNEAEERTP